MYVILNILPFLERRILELVVLYSTKISQADRLIHHFAADSPIAVPDFSSLHVSPNYTLSLYVS